jgi:hypothetical protein
MGMLPHTKTTNNNNIIGNMPTDIIPKQPIDFVSRMFAAMKEVNCTILSEVPTTVKLILVWFYLDAIKNDYTRWYDEQVYAHHSIRVYKDPCHCEEDTNYVSVELPQVVFHNDVAIWIETQIRDAKLQMLQFCMEVYKALCEMESRLIQDAEPYPSKEVTALYVVWQYFYWALGAYRTELVNPYPHTEIVVFQNCWDFESGQKQVVRLPEDVNVNQLYGKTRELFEQANQEHAEHERKQQEQQQQQ